MNKRFFRTLCLLLLFFLLVYSPLYAQKLILTGLDKLVSTAVKECKVHMSAITKIKDSKPIFSGLALDEAYDLLVHNARIVDGTGNPWYRGDIGIKNGVIIAIGNLSSHDSRQVIDAADKVVAPGFIDMMGQKSSALLRDPSSALSKLHQGITTMLSGEGDSPAPQNERTLKEGVDVEGTRLKWRTFDEYFRLLEDRRIALNVVHNVGAGQVRLVVMGEEDRPPSSDEMEQMKTLVHNAMKDGALGLSTALIYPPGAYATTEQLIELARVAAEYDGIYLTHVRNESNKLVEAIEEAIHIGQEAGTPVHIFHLKAAGKENWPLMKEALLKIQEARKAGMDVTADIYPYIRNGIGLQYFIHPRHYAKGTDAFLSTVGDPEVRRTLRLEIETTSDWENWYRHVGKNWENVLVVQDGPHTSQDFTGLTIQEIADLRRVDSWTAFFDLAQSGRVFVTPKSMNEEQKRQALRAPFVMVDTDANPTNPTTAMSSHPRTFGAFPRILAKYVREEGVLSLEEAVKRMSSLPANRLNLHNRGRIAPGMAADLIIFDPERVQDTATFTKPLSYAEGIDVVIINGEVVISEGRWTGARPGKVLRHGR